MRRRVDAVGYSCPLHVVAGALEVARITARHRHEVESWLVLITVGDSAIAVSLAILLDVVAVTHSSDVAHASTEAHGISGYDTTALFRHIGQRYATLLTFGKGERAEINPCAAAHRLVDYEVGLATFMKNRVVGIVGASGQRLIAYIYSIFAILGNIRGPSDSTAFIDFFDGRNHAVSAVCKRVLEVGILFLTIGEARTVSFLPGVEAVVLSIR